MDQPRSRWPRYNLLTLLLVTALVAVSVSHYRTWTDLLRTRASLVALRKAALVLDVTDERQIAAVALPTYGDLQWRWSVHLPEGGEYRLGYAFDQLPESGFPDAPRYDPHVFLDSHAKPLQGGEPFVLRIAFFKGSDGRWNLTTGVPGRSTTRPLEPAPDGLSEARVGWSSKVYGARETIAVEPDERLPLLRRRKAKEVNGGTTVDMDPTDGVMFWIEQID